MGVSRRELMKNAGLLAAAAGFGGGLSLAGSASAQVAEKQAALPDLPWPYKKIDPAVVAEEAYTGYYKGACCYGVFEGIVGQLRKEIGFPYTMVPSVMLVVGQGGVADTASLCGAVNGAASAIFLVAGGMDPKKRELPYSLIQEVFNWYEATAQPDYRPKTPKYEIIKSLSRSTLCHVSVTKWCKASGFKAFSKERSERCAWITATVAKFTAELLNSHADGALKLAYPLTGATKTCRGCHDKGSKLENTRAMMDCGGCHFTPKAKTAHPKL
jgi:hypothetical protein